MIFEKNFDNSLWLILKGDKTNREMIVDLIKTIPPEFFNKIKKAIYKYKEYQITGNYSDNFFIIKESIKVNEDESYGFEINEIGTLDIYKVVTIGNNKYKKFNLCLTDIDNFNSFDYIDNNWIGCFKISTVKSNSDLSFEILREDNSDYNLIISPFGYILSSSHYYDELDIKDYMKRISIGTIPKDLMISDLEKFNKSKKLKKQR